MTDYLLIYQGGDQSWHERSKAETDAAMRLWGEWFKQLEATGNLRNPGAPLGRGGAVLRGNGRGIEVDTAMAEVKELIGGYTIIAADSLEQAAEIAKGTPFLKNQPKGSVLVRPILQIG